MNTLRLSRKFSNFRSFSTNFRSYSEVCPAPNYGPQDTLRCPQIPRKISTSLRSFSGACPSPSYGPLDVGRCTLMNGIKLVSAKPFGAEMAACTVLFQSGSRYECDDQLGATHFMRTCSTASGCSYSTFSKTRVLQQLGSYITVNSDRQSIAFTLRCPVPAFNDVKYYLLDIAARASFVQHEIDAKKPQLKLDLHTVHPEALVLDLAQKACWAGGLNNSVFCEEERIDSMSASDLNAFSALHLRSDACTVGSYGLPFDEMMLFAEQIESNRNQTMEDSVTDIQLPLEEYSLLGRKVDFHQDKPAIPRCIPPSFARTGFEYHDLGPGSDTWIAIVVPGCGSFNLPELMKHNIIAAACGTGNNTRGQHSQDRSPQPPLGCLATDVFTQFKAFNISYAEAGVFGIVAKTRSANAAAATCAIASFLRRIGDLSAEQIRIGKERLKLDISLCEDDCVRVSEGMALQAAYNARLDNACCTINMLNCITENEVLCTLKVLARKCFDQMAIAVVGDVQAVPHDQEILRVC